MEIVYIVIKDIAWTTTEDVKSFNLIIAWTIILNYNQISNLKTYFCLQWLMRQMQDATNVFLENLLSGWKADFIHAWKAVTFHSLQVQESMYQIVCDME